MPKLYAVTAGAYSDYRIVALCSEHQRAEKLVKWYNKFNPYYYANIEEYDDGIMVPDESLNPYEVYFDKNGNIRSIGIGSPMEAIAGVLRECGWGGFSAYILATDEESARKIVSERRAKYIAEKTGVV